MTLYMQDQRGYEVETKEKEEVGTWWWTLALLVGAVGAITVGGVIAYNEYRKRELEALLAR